MNFISSKLYGPIIIEPKKISDDRGFFSEIFRHDLLEKHLNRKISFVQENQSFSIKGTIRGLHYQIPPYAQAKLVRVVKGRVLDVVLDIRKSSPTFGQHISLELSEENMRQIYIPHGFAHGFSVISESATLNYKVDNYYSAAHERGLAFNDKDLMIDWKLNSNDIICSNKDASWPNFLEKNIFFD